jgi:hypothetical protein
MLDSITQLESLRVGLSGLSCGVGVVVVVLVG